MNQDDYDELVENEAFKGAEYGAEKLDRDDCSIEAAVEYGIGSHVCDLLEREIHSDWETILGILQHSRADEIPDDVLKKAVNPFPHCGYPEGKKVLQFAHIADCLIMQDIRDEMRLKLIKWTDDDRLDGEEREQRDSFHALLTECDVAVKQDNIMALSGMDGSSKYWVYAFRGGEPTCVETGNHEESTDDGLRDFLEDRADRRETLENEPDSFNV